MIIKIKFDLKYNINAISILIYYTNIIPLYLWISSYTLLILLWAFNRWTFDMLKKISIRCLEFVHVFLYWDYWCEFIRYLTYMVYILRFFVCKLYWWWHNCILRGAGLFKFRGYIIFTLLQTFHYLYIILKLFWFSLVAYSFLVQDFLDIVHSIEFLTLEVILLHFFNFFIDLCTVIYMHCQIKTFVFILTKLFLAF